MKRVAIAVVASACGAAAPPPTVHNQITDAVPTVQLALADRSIVRLAHTSPTGIVIEREVKTPAPIARLLWSGVDPIVWLSTGELGRIGAHGYAAIGTPAWRRVAQPAPQSMHIDSPMESLFAVAGGQTWASHCEWGMPYDGFQCTETVYTRVDAGGLAIVESAPTQAYVYDDEALPAQAGPSTYRVSLAPQPDDSGRDVAVLSCEGPDGSLQVPRMPDPEYSRGFSEPKWISLSPPLFEADQNFEGMIGWSKQRFFHGCAAEPAGSESATVGPGETVWLRTKSRLEVYWHGKKVGETELAAIAFHVP